MFALPPGRSAKMFTDHEKSHFLRLARESYQARLGAGATPARIAWAYDLLDEAAEAADAKPVRSGIATGPSGNRDIGR
jgi:hypothetical protein